VEISRLSRRVFAARARQLYYIECYTIVACRRYIVACDTIAELFVAKGSNSSSCGCTFRTFLDLFQQFNLNAADSSPIKDGKVKYLPLGSTPWLLPIASTNALLANTSSSCVIMLLQYHAYGEPLHGSSTSATYLLELPSRPRYRGLPHFPCKVR